MNTTIQPETAIIYQFRPRLPQAKIGFREENAPVVDMKSEAVANIQFGSGWYHEAAVQDAKRTPKP